MELSSIAELELNYNINKLSLVRFFFFFFENLYCYNSGIHFILGPKGEHEKGVRRETRGNIRKTYLQSVARAF